MGSASTGVEHRQDEGRGESAAVGEGAVEQVEGAAGVARAVAEAGPESEGDRAQVGPGRSRIIERHIGAAF
ncbi:hypothetical protein ADL00_24890 [Streptomyces sp. AS58]|nr:hypothetical protein ADL00_24890 [Streptomyces sp. AS58]